MVESNTGKKNTLYNSCPIILLNFLLGLNLWRRFIACDKFLPVYAQNVTVSLTITAKMTHHIVEKLITRCSQKTALLIT